VLVIGASFMSFVWNGSRGDSIGQQEENSNPRESALAMLSSLAEEMRDIEDPEERLGLIVRIAEILERDNPERAKVLLITAFEEMLKRDAKTDGGAGSVECFAEADHHPHCAT
jgi:hypothetical protein